MARAAWGTSTARLSRDSFLPFASCSLCLEPAIDPVSCAHGDIFCRECALSNILAQKKDIKRTERERETEEHEAREDQARRDAEAQERAIREFEMTQAGLSIKGAATAGKPPPQQQKQTVHSEPSPSSTETSNILIKTGGGERKRKFSMDQDEVVRIALEERAKARRAIDDEKASKPKLPSFWSPSVTPELTAGDVIHDIKKKVKTQPVCPASSEDNPHHYSLRTLVTVNFTEETVENSSSSTSAKKTKQRICPACKKGLTNASRAALAKPCGHVVCKSCVDKFMKPAASAGDSSGGLRCYVCDADLVGSGKKEKGADKDKDKIRPGLVELRREGTGFSAGGNNRVHKNTVNFAA